MSKTVWKFSLNDSSAMIPRGAKFVAFRDQPDESILLWFEVDPNAEQERLRLAVRGTGHPIPEDEQHLFTFFRPPFVWHVYWAQP